MRATPEPRKTTWPCVFRKAACASRVNASGAKTCVSNCSGDLLIALSGHRADRGAAGVVDEDVDSPEALDRRADDRLRRVVGIDVDRQRDDAPGKTDRRLFERGETLGAPTDREDVVADARGALGQRAADPRGRSGDDHDACRRLLHAPAFVAPARAALRIGRSVSPMTSSPRVGIIMGSLSDLETMRPAGTTLEELGVPFEMRVVSAHRTPDLLYAYAEGAAARGLAVIIAGAGGAAHLPGMTAAKTHLPVIGVPVRSRRRISTDLDSLLSIVQMPAGVPVATVAIGNAANAALLAARILAVEDVSLADRLRARAAAEAAKIEAIEL